jgi:hypothetical protein
VPRRVPFTIIIPIRPTPPNVRGGFAAIGGSPGRFDEGGKLGLAKRVYTLEVCLIEGPVAEDFVKQNPTISRTIEIRGSQTLQHLHRAIFDAFDREEEHMYEFQFGTGPHDQSGDRYVLPIEFNDPFDADSQATGDLTETTIASLHLEVGRAFGYWFDFGDNWYHQIDVVAIGEAEPRRRYPRIVTRVGESPPQYPPLEDDEDFDG